ncbi:TetR family transcriptional regulator [Streptomyces sulfonofaciens]|uniref:TetR family transcriptional regulator n=1 Tax=Streptomyces sulfonofaciens TaxID=68272 RepID=A0A919G526_9ACTN|nr:TetR/AcrR family transcriptional regulator [Streptomyces sulfonofaciens]GHH77849.1 TetR family transcriptional regulator [Streptomyces sulfonofaciens]
MGGREPGLRERTRRAVQQEIVETANGLFVARGYENTTIEDIAAAVGMSRRSVFRYFPTKEDIVVGKFDFVAQDMLVALRARPAAEPVWESLRRTFDLLVAYVDAPGQHEVAEPMQRIVFAHRGLLASYLEKLQRMQDAVVSALRERAEASGRPYGADDPVPGAVAGAAFGCLLAAQHAWLAGGAKDSFAGTLDRAMAAVAPRG